jgi:protein-disulfide isomerase
MIGWLFLVWGVAGVASAAEAVGPTSPTPREKNAKGVAKVVIEEFSDFQCPFCARSVVTLKKILADYNGRVELVFRHFPVVESHPQALLAHMAVEAAGKQGKFWEMHDLVFENMRQVSRPHLFKYAERLKLNPKAFEADLKAGSLLEKIERDYREGLDRQVRATPTFFIGGKKIEGAVPYEVFQAAIDRALATGQPEVGR